MINYVYLNNSSSNIAITQTRMFMGSHLKNLFIMFVLFLLAVMTAEAQELVELESTNSGDSYSDEQIIDPSLDPVHKISTFGISRSPSIAIDNEMDLEGALYNAQEDQQIYAEQSYPQPEDETEVAPADEEYINTDENYSEDYSVVDDQ
jgi:hypothetical protein